jgi:hypothetical protein
MSEDRNKALVLALKSVLSVARQRGLDLDEISEASADELLRYRPHNSDHVPAAINEIEVAVDALAQSPPVNC